MPLNVAERQVQENFARLYGRDRVLTIGRCAILTKSHGGRPACGYCGVCERGCTTYSYFNSVHVTLPAAKATGKLTLRPYSVVHSVAYDPRTGRASGVNVIDAESGEAMRVPGARRLPLCVGARVHPHPAQLHQHPLAPGTGQLERRAGALSHGSLDGWRSDRHGAGTR